MHVFNGEREWKNVWVNECFRAHICTVKMEVHTQAMRQAQERKSLRQQMKVRKGDVG